MGFSFADRAEPDESRCERMIKGAKASPIEAPPFNPARAGEAYW